MNFLVFFCCLLLFFFIFFLPALPLTNLFSYMIFSTKKMILLSIIFSSISVKMVLTVSLIFLAILFFSLYYMKSGPFFGYFIFSMALFVVSMIILCLSNSFFILFIGWDGLGVTSFLLIMFYSNWKSVNNSVFTLLSNRIGDGLLLIFMGLLLFDLSILSKIFLIFFPFSMIVIFVSFTKSAQVPISSWLPAAMAAPTPVSALVHSSTLVTAGVVVLIKFFFSLYKMEFQFILLFFSLLTIFIAGVSALVEMDFKKLIALSTLSQMGLLIFILSVGLKWFGFFHLLSHAFFKSALFLIVGGGLHFVFSQQDWRAYAAVFNFSIFYSTMIFLCLLCLCGLFFSSGFVSKDLFIDSMNNKNISFWFSFMFLISLLLTFFYSTRLMKCVFKKSLYNFNLKLQKGFYSMELSPLPLFFFSVGFSYWMMNNYYFFFSNLVFEKKMFLILMFLFAFMSVLLCFNTFFMKTMGFLDLILKGFFLEEMKKFNRAEKGFLDMFLLGGLSFNKFVFLNKTKGVGLLFLLFFVIICYF